MQQRKPLVLPPSLAPLQPAMSEPNAGILANAKGHPALAEETKATYPPAIETEPVTTTKQQMIETRGAHA